MSAIVARRLVTTLEGHLPATQAGFRPARGRHAAVTRPSRGRHAAGTRPSRGRHAADTRPAQGCRDNVFALKWCIQMTQSQMFLGEALAEARVGAKVHRIVQAIVVAATGVVRLRHPDGTMALSEP